jgi:hypothetical protein
MKRPADFMDDQELKAAEKATKLQTEFRAVLNLVIDYQEHTEPENWETFYNHALPLGCSEFTTVEQKIDPEILILQYFKAAITRGYDLLVEDFCLYNDAYRDTIKKYIHIRLMAGAGYTLVQPNALKLRFAP